MRKCRKGCVIHADLTYRLDRRPRFAQLNGHTARALEGQLWERHSASGSGPKNWPSGISEADASWAHWFPLSSQPSSLVYEVTVPYVWGLVVGTRRHVGESPRPGRPPCVPGKDNVFFEICKNFFVLHAAPETLPWSHLPTSTSVTAAAGLAHHSRFPGRALFLQGLAEARAAPSLRMNT